MVVALSLGVTCGLDVHVVVFARIKLNFQPESSSSPYFVHYTFHFLKTVLRSNAAKPMQSLICCQTRELLGKMVVLVANLAPRKMKFGLSEGMICAAGENVPHVILANGAQPGDRIR